MKRVVYHRYGGPEVMRFEEFALPAPGAGEVQVAIKAAALNAFDWKVRQGMMKLVLNRRFPKAMGSDLSGIVVAVGPGVADFTAGDAVFGSVDVKRQGAFAEGVVAKAAELIRKPASVSFVQAAALTIPGLTAAVAILDRAKAAPGRRILIYGAIGAVGAAAIQIAQTQGADIVAVGSANSLRQIADRGVRAYAYGDAALAQEPAFDAVFDTVGTLAVGKGLRMLRRGGVFIDINPTPSRAARGFITGRYRLAFATMGSKHLPLIASLADQGLLTVAIAQEAPLHQAIDLIAAAERGTGPRGKTVFLT